MPSTHKHIRSSTANKRPTTAIADGQIALNTNSTSPGLFFKDSTGATIIKLGPVHVGTTAPNVSPAAGGSSGNSTGEVWLDTSLTPNGVKIWNGSSWTNATPIGSTTVQGLLELATNAETQTGSDTDRAVTPAGLQSKLSDSTSTTSSTTIASSTAVKAAYDLADAALPKAGGTVTGNLEIGTAGSLTFEGSTADGFETTLAVTDPTADRTITLPNVSGTVVTTGDTGTVTSTMIADGTIVDADVSASAEIAVSKLADGTARQLIQTDAAGTGVEWTSNIDIPGTLDVTSTATFDSIASHPLGSAAAPTITFTGDTNTGLYSPGADQLALATGGTGRLFVDASGNVGVAAAPSAFGTRTAIQLNGSTSNWFAGGANGLTLFSRNLYNDGGNKFIGTGYASNYYQSTAGDHVWERSSASGTAGAAATMQEAMRITSAGNVGIGTTSPGVPLQVTGQIRALDGGVDLRLNPTLAGIIGTYSNHDLPIYTNGSEKARIDSSGRLLVGTSSASTTPGSFTAKLQVQGTSVFDTGIVNALWEANANPVQLQLVKSRGASIGTHTVVQNNDNLGRILFGGSDGTAFKTAAWIQCDVDGTPGANDMPGRLVFSTTADGASTPTERMRISSAGTISAEGDVWCKTGVFPTSTGANAGRIFNSSIGSTTTTLYIGNASITTSSDVRLKENIADTERDALQIVNNLRVVDHTWNDPSDQAPNNKNSRGPWMGLIAQEAIDHIPWLVNKPPADEDEDGNPQYWFMDFGYAVPLLVKALQQATERIETLEAKVAALEAA